MKNLFKLLTTLCLLTCLLSCRQENNPEPNPTNNLDDYGQTVWQVEQIASELESLVRGLWEHGNTYLACANVTYQNETDDLVTTITYSATTPCSDGKTRTGKLIIRKKATQSSLEATVYLDNYYVNGQKIEGMYGYLQLNQPGKTFALHSVVNDGKILSPNGHFVNYNFSRKSYWQAGQETPTNFTDDAVELYEANYGITLKNKGLFLADVTNALTLKKACHVATGLMPVQGKISIRTTDNHDSILNFGDGTCTAQPRKE